MARFTLPKIANVLRATSGRLFGRVTAGTGRAEELTPAQVRSLLSVYTIAQTDSAIAAGVAALVDSSPATLDTLNELAAALGDDPNFATTITTALAGKVDASTLSESIDDRVASLLVAGTNITLTYNDASNTLTIASTAGGLSGTGAVDNAALRADGTGGATLQSSAWIINDNLTASPNSTVNHACLEATGATTNVSVSIKPKGTGAFSLAAPDGAAAGGNARGASAVDLQLARSAAAQVASGQSSFTVGAGNTASSFFAVAMGFGNTASGYASFVVGETSTASGNYAVAIGRTNTASGGASISIGSNAAATRLGQFAHANGEFAAVGDAQFVRFVLRNKTTNATATTLALDGGSVRLLTITSGRVNSLLCRICGVKSDGSAVANYVRRVVIKNVSGTTSLVGSVETIGTDIEDNASTDVAITADDTNDALQINVTGITGETWRWVAVVEGVEIAYGT